MSNVKISDLVAASLPLDAAALMEVEIPGTPSVSRKIAVADAFSGPGPTPADEAIDWLMLAASLDPAAYTYLIAPGWTLKVPAGKTYYVMNAWNCQIGSSGPTFFHRNPRAPYALSQYTRVQGNGVSNAFLYYFDPSLVASDPAYDDPKALYFWRRARINEMVHNGCFVRTPASDTGNKYQDFPGDFDNGIVLLANAFNTAWCILDHDPVMGGMNLMNEISDVHQWRSAEPIFVPFSRATFPAIAGSCASVLGTGTSTIDGISSLIYIKTPAAWKPPTNVVPSTGWSGVFQSKGDLASVAHASPLNLTAGLSIDLWVYAFANDVANYPVLVCKGNNNAAYQLQIDNDAPQKGVMCRIKIGGVSKDAKDPALPTRGAWTRYTATYDGTNLRLYKNGTVVATTAATGNIDTNADPLRFGDADTLEANSFFGLMANATIWNRALSGAEITASMATPWTGAESGLVAGPYWTGGFGDEIVPDGGPNGLDLTVANSHQWSYLRGMPF